MSKLVVSLFILALITGCAVNKQKMSTKNLIQALVERGSDVNKEHLIRYHIYCITKEDLDHVVKLATSEGFVPEESSYFKTDYNWYIALNKHSPLKFKPIYSSVKLLTKFQENRSCQKVTWGSSVER
ncbi:ribonuclease E inhibitor RraB [Thalassotalea marina]|uniref:Regulator of ribonuclease activity B domain-containing protein n=1 Tax=Thalassotalea marina TaxID=1673741 RepID=A0A919BQJ1_9GAMM|nr:ribonuclease E inhibitor RraB [Thalassotalea marina]GHG05885.1 hypothetical protein GCM10017161_39290 [Thalassotalea marina]